MKTFTTTGYICERCDHRWVPNIAQSRAKTPYGGQKDLPRICPACKSPYWDKARKRK